MLFCATPTLIMYQVRMCALLRLRKNGKGKSSEEKAEQKMMKEKKKKDTKKEKKKKKKK